MDCFTINLKDYITNLNKRNQKSARNYNYCITSYFQTEITITKEDLISLFNNPQYYNNSLIVELFYGINEQYKEKFIEFIFENGKNKVFKRYFIHSLIDYASVELVEKNLEFFISLRRKLPNTLIKKLVLKLKNNPEAISKIYSTITSSTLKRELIKYIPAPAIALSDKDLELRDLAKKTLGLKKKIINYKQKIKTEIRNIFSNLYPDVEFTPYQTAEFIFHTNPKISTDFKLIFNWESVYKNSSSFDSNLIYFSIGTRSIEKINSREYPKRFISMELENPIIERRINSSYIYQVHKKDFEKFIDFIKNDLKEIIKTHIEKYYPQI